MIGTTHVNSHVDCIGTSNNYIKVNPFANEGIDWERRENVLARLLDYDTKYQTSINDPNQLLVLTDDELRMRDYFETHNWMVFRGDPKKQKDRPQHIEPKCDR